jgi:uncharacterized small protein (DUF1192 family)
MRREEVQLDSVAIDVRAAETMDLPELRAEIARLTGIYAHRTNSRDAFTVLMRIAGALGTGGRA